MGRFKTSEERLRKKQMKNIVNQLNLGKKPMPRQIDEINKEYSAACAKLGSLKYKTCVFEKEIGTLLERIAGLDAEAAERNKLDKELEEAIKSTQDDATESQGAPDVQA